jgi:hypothetical protein
MVKTSLAHLVVCRVLSSMIREHDLSLYSVLYKLKAKDLTSWDKLALNQMRTYWSLQLIEDQLNAGQEVVF